MKAAQTQLPFSVAGSASTLERENKHEHHHYPKLIVQTISVQSGIKSVSSLRTISTAISRRNPVQTTYNFRLQGFLERSIFSERATVGVLLEIRDLAWPQNKSPAARTIHVDAALKAFCSDVEE